MHQPSGRWQLGLAMALTTATMWGLLPIALKGILGPLDATTITWYRFAVAAALVGAIYLVRGGFRWRQLRQRHLALLMLGAVLGLLSNYWFYLVGLNYSTAEASQVMIQLAPLLLIAFSLWLYKEPFAPSQLLGIMAVLVGIGLFFNLRLPQLAQEITALEGRYSLGLACITISAITWAFYGLAQKQLLKDFSSQEVLLVIYIAGSVAFFPGASPLDVQQLNQVQWAYLIFSALNTVIAYGAFAYALEHWEASRVSATVTITPILTAGFVFLTAPILPDTVTPEPMNSWSWLGAFLVVAGSMTTALARPKAVE